MKLLHTLLLILGINIYSLAQTSVDTLRVGMNENSNRQIPMGYGYQAESSLTGSVYHISEEAFNIGNFNDPRLLLRGKVPGLGVYQKGSDPNGTTNLRIRGISAMGNQNSYYANNQGQVSQPLIIIDGIIGASLENVDPNDIESFTVLKDGPAAAIYGMRAANGVMLVTTKNGQRNAPIKSTYRTYLSADQLTRPLPSMNRNEFLAAGGNDLESDTDWLNEVSRTGISNVHNLAISGGGSQTSYRFSVNYRNVNGILKSSGFEQINARAGMNYWGWSDRLNVQFNMSMTQRESEYGFREAFRYAAVMNPTAPVRFESGNYYQAIFFDNYNPLAILNQNQNDGKRKNLNYDIKATFEILDGLTIHAQYGRQQAHRLNGEFYPSNSFFRGSGRNGLASRYTSDQQFDLFESFLRFDKKWQQLDLTAQAGYSYQNSFFEQLSLSMGNLPSNQLGYYGIDLSGDRVLGDENPNVSSGIGINSSATPLEKYIAWFGRAQLSFNKLFVINTSLRYEGNTRLGVNNRWGMFPAISTALNLKEMLSLSAVSNLNIRTGIGITGNLPATYGMSQDAYAYNYFEGGRVDYLRAGNPDLRWERSAEINLGMDLGLFEDRFTVSFDFYRRNISDIIQEVEVDFEQFGTYQRFQNQSKLRVSGADISLNYQILNNLKWQWKSGLILSRNKALLEKFTVKQQLRANPGAPGQGSAAFIRVAEDEVLGQLWGPEFKGVDETGVPIFEDLNGDGIVNAVPGFALAEEGDSKNLGNGFPTLELGWTNQLQFGFWDANLFFRGAFGHSLINTHRYFYEPIDPGAINSYNRVVTDKAIDDLSVSFFSSLYAEKANFLRLDNVTIGRSFSSSKNAIFNKFRVYGNIQNAFTLTNYTGADPDVSISDFGPVDNGGYLDPITDPLSPGIDRRNFYYTARTFLIGLELSF